MAGGEVAGHPAGSEYLHYTGDLARWCKQSVFDALNLDIRKFEHSPLIQLTPCFLKKSEESIRILREWMELCRQFNLVSSPTPEEKSRCRDNFAAHTHDQTLWSLVAAMNRLDCLYSGKGGFPFCSIPDLTIRIRTSF